MFDLMPQGGAAPDGQSSAIGVLFKRDGSKGRSEDPGS
jgi:hypothetical protein